MSPWITAGILNGVKDLCILLTQGKCIGPSRSRGSGTVRALVIFQKQVADLTDLALERYVSRARRAAGLKGKVNVLVTTSAEMKFLNQSFRGKEKPTDVLSFPSEADGEKEFAGEIAISAEIATQNALFFGHSPAEEVKILVLHGILHLRGYDHERDGGQMERRERELRTVLHLPAGLIERVARQEVKTSPRSSKKRVSKKRVSKNAASKNAASKKRALKKRASKKRASSAAAGRGLRNRQP